MAALDSRYQEHSTGVPEASLRRNPVDTLDRREVGTNVSDWPCFPRMSRWVGQKITFGPVGFRIRRMRPARKRKLWLWGVLAVLLLTLAAYIKNRLDVRSSSYPVTADPYVPCPAGTHPQPDQRHICVPD